MTIFCSLFSGSSGNCTLVGTNETAVLIDVGVSAKAICNALASMDYDISKIAAIFITHEHIDHIRGLTQLVSKYKIPVYANKGTIQGILKLKDIDTNYIFEMATGETNEIADMCISSFSTSHDSNESVGYRIFTSDGKKIAVATDLGVVSDTVLENIKYCDVVMLESNHDVRMLQNGKYPYFLKRRILSTNGHLSNDDCSSVLPILVENGTKYIFLAHISKDNNFPELAIQTAVSLLQMSGLIQNKDYYIEAAPQLETSKICCI
jgi:phosphoribosyl 1,2-cyclic phosphodiesterase